MASVNTALFVLLLSSFMLLNSCTALSNPLSTQMNPSIPGLVDSDNFDRSFLRALYSSYASHYRLPENVPLKRSGGHQVEIRSMNQFKNCYFSPVQCVLLERRRRR
uniref:Uncharacterized protein n=2 Tax=Panagrolaimus sp. PS1159 TaxID=55785 RepID=A0AC35GXK6_9BILA